MRGLLLFLMLLTGCRLGGCAQPPSLGSSQTNELIIECDGPWEYVGSKTVWQDNVRVTNGLTTLRCEVLTVHFQTNQTSQTNSAKIDRLVAETNVVVRQPEGEGTGHLAIYTATNDLVVLIGHGAGPDGNAKLRVAQGSFVGPRVYFDRKDNRIWAPRGRFVLHSDAFGKPGIGLFSTNALRLPGAKPRDTNAPPAK